jgi:hypothetical protein
MKKSFFKDRNKDPVKDMWRVDHEYKIQRPGVGYYQPRPRYAPTKIFFYEDGSEL